jgi:transposase-like protein
MDYPKNYPDFIKRFATEESCFDYLASIRWKDGFVCSACSSKNFWKSKRMQWICSDCKFHNRVLAGTLFQDTKLPLSLWFQMIWWFMGPKNGVSALALQQNFGLGSYRTAWKFLAKLRSCTVQSTRSPLSGFVEVDQAFLGGENNKEIIIIAAEKRGFATGRIRLVHLETQKAEKIQGFIINSIELGSTIVSDRHKSYPSIVTKGYSHEAVKKPYFWEEVDGDDERLLPRVGRVASLLKRWFYGTYQGRIEKNNLQSYLDEFVFRFNRRSSTSRGLLFHRMLESAVNSKPNTQ